MVDILSSPPFYTNHVILPNANNPVPPEIQQNPKFWPYFQGALGAIDGSHINFAALHHSRIYTETEKALKLSLCLLSWSSILLCSHWMGRLCH